MSDSEKPKSAASPLTSYTCPGELYSIPREIHLARLAAFYSKCRDCEHRVEAGHGSPTAPAPHKQAERPPTKSTLLTDESVRGVHLNELDRNRAILWGEALAAALWDEQPMIARRAADPRVQIVGEQSDTDANAGLRGPTVVVGFDERPSSPDIVTGAVLGLRRMGCPVIDLGQTALPIVAFHVHAQDAAAGLFVTGAGCDPALTGFELLRRKAKPFPPDALQQIEQFVKTGVGRQTRQIGRHQPHQGQDAYEASLASHFHALCPLKIVCGCSTRLQPRVLNQLFARLPCSLTYVSLPQRRRNLFDARDVDLHRVATTVVEGQHHLGLIIDEDGRRLAFVTDRGRLVSPREVARLVIEIAQREYHGAQFVVASSWVREAQGWLESRQATVIDGGESAAGIVELLDERNAVLALSADGRIWFQQRYPTCDAMLVLANVLKALSLGDAPFSEVIARISDE